MHRHRCWACFTVWEHPDAVLAPDGAHDCPKCGHQSFVVYEGVEEVTVRHEGTRTREEVVK